MGARRRYVTLSTQSAPSWDDVNNQGSNFSAGLFGQPFFWGGDPLFIFISISLIFYLRIFISGESLQVLP